MCLFACWPYPCGKYVLTHRSLCVVWKLKPQLGDVHYVAHIGDSWHHSWLVTIDIPDDITGIRNGSHEQYMYVGQSMFQLSCNKINQNGQKESCIFRQHLPHENKIGYPGFLTTCIDKKFHPYLRCPSPNKTTSSNGMIWSFWTFWPCGSSSTSNK